MILEKKDIMHCWITLAEYEKKAVTGTFSTICFQLLYNFFKKNTALNVTSVLKLHPIFFFFTNAT